ncbi:MAG: hypothetical protein PHV30_09360 [Candidatus Margulisbacteria bacterium]|nr:hypothetical protein [Candidatus Margulisiibacteriota bacterium]
MVTDKKNETQIEETIKRVGLRLSDLISTKLKILFNCKFVEKKLVTYETIQQLDRKFYTFTLLHNKKQPIMQIMDTNIIYILTNRILGGEGIVEVRRFKELFTFSENYFGRFFIDWIIEAFANNGLDLSLDKIADSPKYYHLYLPEEKIMQFVFEIYIGPQNIGMYYICFDPALDLKKESVEHKELPVETKN